MVIVTNQVRGGASGRRTERLRMVKVKPIGSAEGLHMRKEERNQGKRPCFCHEHHQNMQVDSSLILPANSLLQQPFYR